jgi:hypothetical protein
MFKINSQIALKIIILFALLNSSIFIGLAFPGGIIRLIITIFMNVSGVLMIIYFVKISKTKLEISFYFKFLFLLLLIWSLFTIFRSIQLNSTILMTLFGHYLMGWAWLTPLAIVFGFNIKNWISLFGYAGKLLFFISFFVLGFPIYSEYNFGGFLEWMAFLPVLILTYFIQNKKSKRIIPLAMIAYLLFSFGASQRVNLLFISLLSLFFFIEFLRETKINIIKKIAVMVIISISILFITLQVDSFFKKLSSNEELTTDTRTFLFVEMLSDMSIKETIIGRGALGTYISPYFYMLKEQEIAGGDSYIRSVNEVGYLQMILKGGYIMMILYLLILLPAAFLGIFRSKNIVGRMSGYLILSYLLVWTVSYYPIYSVEYILLWMAAGTAISSTARNMKIELVKSRTQLT